MIYKNFKGMDLSALGFGAMRLPTLGEDPAQVDEAQTAQMIAYAMEHGVNYYDTAWGYHNGESETVMGKLLAQYPRDSFYLATKFPGYDLSNIEKHESIFEQQLAKCQTDYFDFYLVHNVCELNIDAYLNKENGLMAYLLKQKESGRIRHFGFSAHGSYDVMKRFLDEYAGVMEFCQIQLNYIDYTLQNSKEKMELLQARDIPVWVMEPLRGGKLATIDENHAQTLKALRAGETVPAWAFRFLQTLPVSVTLSGMSNFQQLKENIATYETDAPLNAQEMQTLLTVADEMVSKTGVPCTACRYCTSYCPQGLDIPHLLDLYNEHSFTGGGFIVSMAMGALEEGKRPAGCIGCGACEAVCPQQIKIPEVLADFAEKLKG